MVDVAQLVEPRIVIPAVAGSNPVVHPTLVQRAQTPSVCTPERTSNISNGGLFHGLSRPPIGVAATMS